MGDVLIMHRGTGPAELPEPGISLQFSGSSPYQGYITGFRVQVPRTHNFPISC